jgi:DNA-binding FrmR family transcriptional regulator
MFNFTKKITNPKSNVGKKDASIGRHFILSEGDKTKTTIAINKIIGQLETIKKDVNADNACDETLTQILSIRGGVSSLGRNLVGKGILDCLESYSREEMELVIKNLFKLD